MGKSRNEVLKCSRLFEVLSQSSPVAFSARLASLGRRVSPEHLAKRSEIREVSALLQHLDEQSSLHSLVLGRAFMVAKIPVVYLPVLVEQIAKTEGKACEKGCKFHDCVLN